MRQDISYIQTFLKPVTKSEGQYCTTFSLDFVYKTS